MPNGETFKKEKRVEKKEQDSINPRLALLGINPDELTDNAKTKGFDWDAFFNPSIPRSFDISLLHSFTHVSVVCCSVFSPDGSYVATGCNKSTTIFRMQDGMKLCELIDADVDTDRDNYIRCLRFSPDGKFLITGGEDRRLRLWDVEARKILKVFDGHEQDIYDLDVSPDGKYLVSGSGDRTVRIWDMQSSSLLRVLKLDDGVTSVAVSPNGKFVAAGSLDTSVRIWSIESGLHIEKLEGHSDSVYSVAFSKESSEIVSASLDKTLRKWKPLVQGLQPIEAAARYAEGSQVFEGHTVCQTYTIKGNELICNRTMY